MQRITVLLAASAFLAPPPSAQSVYATQVVDFQQGPGAGIFVTDNVLGGPQGGGLFQGSFDVLTLGSGGSVTLGFDVVLRDLPGADLAVFENGFLVSGSSDVFAEVAYVEVSTDGATWARFPSRYGPPPGGGTPIGTYGGLAGGTPVLADVTVDPGSPLDPVSSGGEAFDLADLAEHPEVLAGNVDLQQVGFVRLVDVMPGDVDSGGQPIGGSGTGASDFDAVAVLHHTLQPAGQPVCDFALDDDGFLVWRLGDPDGAADLNVPTLSASASLNPLPLATFLSLFQFVSFDGQTYELRSVIPVDSTAFLATLSVSVEDLGGALGGDQVVLQL